MDLPIITMEPAEAHKAFLAYRTEVEIRRRTEHWNRQSLIARLSEADQAAREQVAAEDEALLAGYRQIAAGKSVISLTAALAGGGITKDGYPRLGIARSDQLLVGVRWEGDVARFWPTGVPRWRSPRTVAESKRFDIRMLPIAVRRPGEDRIADVPRVPAWLRPSGDLSRYATLFEAGWRRPQTTRRVGDPALLRPLGGDLYAVVATWDLTPLERAVLGIEPA